MGGALSEPSGVMGGAMSEPSGVMGGALSEPSGVMGGWYIVGILTCEDGVAGVRDACGIRMACAGHAHGALAHAHEIVVCTCKRP